MLRKILKPVNYSLLIGVITLLLFELSFRIQLIDFYKSELVGLNPNLQKGEKPVLIFGDSFTAHYKSYVSFLRRSHPESNIVNCAIAGSGIRQHELLFNRRVTDYQPKHIIYQFYVGNDFLDIKHLINYDSIPLFRNIYWSVSNQLLGVQYLNYRLAFLRSNDQQEATIRKDSFSPIKYNKREKLNFKSAPFHLENTINIKGVESNNYQVWKNKFQALISKVDSNILISLVVVPHCAQVNKSYQNRMQSIGAKFNSSLQTINYPLIQKLRNDFPEIQIINPLNDFQKAENEGIQLYYENDPHLTYEGHEVLARFLNETLF